MGDFTLGGEGSGVCSGGQGGDSGGGEVGEVGGGEGDFEAAPPGADVDGGVVEGALVEEGGEATALAEGADAAEDIAGRALGGSGVGHLGALALRSGSQGLEVQAGADGDDRDDETAAVDG